MVGVRATMDFKVASQDSPENDLFFHDNAPSHTASFTAELIKLLQVPINVQTSIQPRPCPPPPPIDFYLLLDLKKARWKQI